MRNFMRHFTKGRPVSEWTYRIILPLTLAALLLNAALIASRTILINPDVHTVVLTDLASASPSTSTSTSISIESASSVGRRDRHRAVISASDGEGRADARADAPGVMNEERMLEITARNHDLVYLNSADVLVASTPKGGTSMLWKWLYRGLAGKSWSGSECKLPVQNKESTCWQGLAVYLDQLPISDRWRVLTSNTTLRLAVFRNPYDRLISTFKSKFMCNSASVVSDPMREHMVPALRNHCNRPSASEACMDIAEFATALDECRRHVGNPGFVPTLRELDVHVRPQLYRFDDIDYDLVFEINDLRFADVLSPLLERLPYRDLVAEGVPYPNKTGKEDLDIPFRAAIKLHRFAGLSEKAVFKYAEGHAPPSFEHHI